MLDNLSLFTTDQRELLPKKLEQVDRDGHKSPRFLLLGGYYFCAAARSARYVVDHLAGPGCLVM